jgi:hypothetical protein
MRKYGQVQGDSLKNYNFMFFKNVSIVKNQKKKKAELVQIKDQERQNN